MDLNERVEKLERAVRGLEIDCQSFLKKNKAIVPGMGSKIAYDANGLVVAAKDLTISDIPDIDISKVIGLTERLEEVTSNLESIRHSMEKDETDSSTLNEIHQTGTKVNVDGNGRVVSVSDLIVEDIPQLPIDKIDGLSELIQDLRNSIPQTNVVTPLKSYSNNMSRSDIRRRLTMDDVPMEMINRLNELESRFVDYLPTKLFESSMRQISQKVDIHETQLSEKLHPESTPMNYINFNHEIETKLNQKVDHFELSDLHTTVSTLMESMSKVGSVIKLRSDVDSKAEDSELQELKQMVKKLQSDVTNLMNVMPSEMISQELLKMSGEISSISSRVSTLESSNS